VRVARGPPDCSSLALSPACFSGGALGDAIDLEAIDRRLGFLKDNNDNVIELASPLR
jgi:hypothetical protein